MRLSASLVAVVVFGACQTPQPNDDAAARSKTFLNERGQVQMVSGEFATAGTDAASAARAFLASRAKEFRLDLPGLELTVLEEKEGLAGTYVHFEQRQAGLPVFKGDVVVLVQQQAAVWVVRAANLTVREEAAAVVPVVARPATDAVARALELLNVRDPQLEPDVVKGVHLTDDGTPVVVYRVRVVTAEPHDWEVMLDAATLVELARQDRRENVDGTALVYDANPVASTGTTTFVDGNNATTAALDAARFRVTLPRLDSSGFTRGLWVDARTATIANRASSPTFTFDYDRSQLGFEQANVYFHLDRTQSRIQQLGFRNVNNRQQIATVDGTTEDNSFYTASTRTISYGVGGVDDAEDGDIINHEYGHSTQHDQVSSWGGGDERSMGEGFGDYLAASFAEVLAPDAGHAQRTDSKCVGDWDAVAYSRTTPKCLRRMDTRKHWPEAIANEVHDDGEMWAAALWGIREQLGGDVTDRLVLESHFLMGGNASFATAAQAMQTTDTTLFAGAHVDVIRRRMIRQGLSRQLTSPLAGGATSNVTVSIDNPRAGSNYTASLDDTQTYTVPGALGLVVHFASFATQASTTPASTDNIYLTNAAGDLFQVLNGTQSNVSSVAIVGDTVNIRLVTNAAANFFGYHVDRIDVIVPKTDGGFVTVDAGVDAGAPDAGVDGGSKVDAGFDAGVPDAGRDAGVEVDAGLADAGRPDSGLVADAGPLDAGADAGAVPIDAGSDAGNPNQGAVVPAVAMNVGKAAPTGCGCATGTVADAWLLMPLLGFVLRRRRTPTIL